MKSALCLLFMLAVATHAAIVIDHPDFTILEIYMKKLCREQQIHVNLIYNIPERCPYWSDCRTNGKSYKIGYEFRNIEKGFSTDPAENTLSHNIKNVIKKINKSYRGNFALGPPKFRLLEIKSFINTKKEIQNKLIDKAIISMWLPYSGSGGDRIILHNNSIYNFDQQQMDFRYSIGGNDHILTWIISKEVFCIGDPYCSSHVINPNTFNLEDLNEFIADINLKYSTFEVEYYGIKYLYKDFINFITSNN